MKRTLGALILLSLTVPVKIQAQGSAQVKPGDRLRVNSSECFQEARRLRFSSITEDTLWATSRNKDVGCPISQISGIEVFRPTSVLKTSSIGLGAGAAAGLLIMAVPYGSTCGGDCDMGGVAAIVGAVLGGGVGLVAGMVTGLTRKLGRWKEVPLPLVQPSSFVSRGNRLNLGISIPLRR